MRIQNLDKKGLALIAEVEGCKLSPYLDVLNIPTIGIGATHYVDNKRVTLQDKPLTLEEAYQLCSDLCKPLQTGVDSITRDDITQGMFNALVSFCYNGGLGMLKGSELLKKINLNPTDPEIKNEFMKFVWGHKRDVNGKMIAIRIPGLVNRRKKEYAMFIS